MSPWIGDRPIVRPIQHRRNTDLQAWVEWIEHTIPVFERSNMLRAIGRAGAVLGCLASETVFSLNLCSF
jgi:hypothetical protein